MAATAKLKKGTPAQFDRAFLPVAREIGYLAHSWNSLHEQLGVIFAYMILPATITIPLAIWYSTNNDRSQREMLRAANRAWVVRNKSKFQKMSNELVWLLNEADKLADKRNDALHAPLSILMDTSTFEFWVEPNYFWGNPRARKLEGKDLRLEFKKYRAQIRCLNDYAVRIHLHLASLTPLPERPSLPTDGQYPIRRGRSRRAPTKQPRHRLRSSRE
jgi:hypothetical protein